MGLRAPGCVSWSGSFISIGPWILIRSTGLRFIEAAIKSQLGLYQTHRRDQAAGRWQTCSQIDRDMQLIARRQTLLAYMHHSRNHGLESPVEVEVSVEIKSNISSCNFVLLVCLLSFFYHQHHHHHFPSFSCLFLRFELCCLMWACTWKIASLSLIGSSGSPHGVYWNSMAL